MARRPEGAIAMWSMLVRLLGMRRSWRTGTSRRFAARCSAAFVLAAGGCDRGAWMEAMGFDERTSAVSRLNWNRFREP